MPWSRRIVVLAFLTACTANDDIHAPALASVTPAHATPGTSVVLSGSYFCQQPEPHGGGDVDPLACAHLGSVLFGSAPVSASQYTDTSIMVEVPTIATGTIDVRVSVAGRTSNSVSLTID